MQQHQQKGSGPWATERRSSLMGPLASSPKKAIPENRQSWGQAGLPEEWILQVPAKEPSCPKAQWDR